MNAKCPWLRPERPLYWTRPGRRQAYARHATVSMEEETVSGIPIPRWLWVALLRLRMRPARATENRGKRLGPYALSKLRGNALTAPLAIRFGLGGGSHCVSAASATGGAAVVHAASLIRTLGKLSELP